MSSSVLALALLLDLDGLLVVRPLARAVVLGDEPDLDEVGALALVEGHVERLGSAVRRLRALLHDGIALGDGEVELALAGAAVGSHLEAGGVRRRLADARLAGAGDVGRRPDRAGVAVARSGECGRT